MFSKLLLMAVIIHLPVNDLLDITNNMEASSHDRELPLVDPGEYFLCPYEECRLCYICGVISNHFAYFIWLV